jgi:hypothetical protein
VARLSTVPTSVWAITVLFGVLGVYHATLTPLGTTPDEHTHTDLVFHLAEGEPYPAYDGRITSQAAWDALFAFHHSELLPNVPAKRERLAPQIGRTFVELGGDRPADNGSFNQMPQHPPLYYEAMAAVVRVDRAVTGGTSSWFEEWHRARLASFAPLVALPLLCWSAARRLGAAPPASVGASAATLAVPQLFHVTTGINNDALLVALGAVLAWLLAGVLAGRLGQSTAVAVGVVTGLALLTKGFAVVFPVWVAVVYGVAARRHGREVRTAVSRLVTAGLVTSIVAGWWWVGNFARHGTPVPTTESRLYTEAMRPPGFEADPVWFLQRFAAWLPRRFVGWFGWFEVPLTFGVAVAVAALFGVAAVVALARPLPGVSRRALAALASVVAMLGLFVLVRAFDLYTTTGQTPFIQGRYLFAGFVPIVILVGLGVARVAGRWAPVVLVAVAVGVQLEAIRVMLGGFWGEWDGGSLARSIESMSAWAPQHAPTPVVAFALGVATTAALVTTVAAAIGRTPRGSR